MEKKAGLKNKWWIIVVLVVVGVAAWFMVFFRPAIVSAGDLTAGIVPGQVTPMEDLTKGNAAATNFGVRMLQYEVKKGGNVLISPVSLLCALSMTANGAEGETLAQMEQVLGLKAEELNPYIYTYISQLPQNEKYRLKLANSIWFSDEEAFTVEEQFLQTNADYYGAQIYKRAFDETAAKDINAWVKAQTDKMILKIVEEIPEDAVMYLVNALAFDAEWEIVYEQAQVRDGIFTLEDGTTRKTRLMYSTENLYLEDEMATGMVKYYKDGKYAFVGLLPKKGVSVAEYVNSLTGAHVRELLAAASQETVYVAVPEFKVEYSTELNTALSDMGMPTAFHPVEADFSGLGYSTRPGGNIYINRALHKTYISVGPKGTKAAATTAVEMLDNGSSVYVTQPKEVYLDRPFVYMLIDTENNLPFFIGTLMDIK